MGDAYTRSAPDEDINDYAKALGEFRGQRRELLEIVYSMPDLIQRAWEHRDDEETRRLLDALATRIENAKKRAERYP